MPTLTHKTLPTPETFEARQLARGLVLVPYWGVDENGQRVARCKWVAARGATAQGQEC